jgi:hypothetical protein
MRKNLVFTVMFILANMLFAGFMQVYKVSYNAMNSEHIVTADVSFDDNEGVTEFKILDMKIKTDIPFKEIISDEKFLYTLYIISDSRVKSIAEFINYTEKIIH